jgi:hypothetical protein
MSFGRVGREEGEAAERIRERIGRAVVKVSVDWAKKDCRKAR